MQKSIESIIGMEIKKIVVDINTEFIPVSNEILVNTLVFQFEDCELAIRPIVDTDEIELTICDDKSLQYSNGNLFDHLRGKSVKMIWRGTNQNGYFDLLTLGFHHLHPDITILSEGSVLKIFELQMVIKGQ
jgi:hypothetical protein